MVLTALVLLTAPLVDAVEDEGDEPRVGEARVPLWAGPQDTLNQRPSQLPQDNPHVTIVGLEGLSTSGVYELCLDSSPGHSFLDRGCHHLSALCCTGFE